MALQIEGFHAVQPKKDCPHCTEENIAPNESFEGVHVNDPCVDCPNQGENWVCLKPGCRGVRCSRYVNSHQVAHYMDKPDHPICFSFADFSFWCYACDSYIEHPLLKHTMHFYLQKFTDSDSQQHIFEKMRASKHEAVIAEEDEDEDEAESPLPVSASSSSAAKNGSNEEEKKEEDIGDLVAGMQNLNVSESEPPAPGHFTYQDLVDGLKQNKFKKILVMTGAGISVSAGIPDFRTPGTGLYDNLQEYNLPDPTAIFEISYFRKNPQAFYKWANYLDLDKFDATPSHYFIKMLQEKGILWKNMTQNIDNLEEKTEMNMDDVVQCHGANRGAHCSKCQKKFDQAILRQNIKDQVILRCDECDNPVKPEVTFFGEGLPSEFFESMTGIAGNVDLLIVMGTALAVGPFNMLPRECQREVPKILFNMNNTKETGGMDFTEENSYKLFVEGKCDEKIRKLVADCGWTEDFEAILPAIHKKSATEETLE